MLTLLLSACVPQDNRTNKASGSASAKPEAVSPPAPTQPRTPTREGNPQQIEAAQDPRLGEAFSDDFERGELGSDWRATSPVWRIEDGQLCGERARNHPIWLKRRLPINARIEFDAKSYAAAGDIKAELWGNGYGAASGVSYSDASSYLTIFGGWNNQFHVLARIDEHAKDRPQIRLDPKSNEAPTRQVKPGQVYRFKVERSDGRTVNWWVDDALILSYPDKQPLGGPGHEHFAFNDWDAKLCFDNLAITPL